MRNVILALFCALMSLVLPRAHAQSTDQFVFFAKAVPAQTSEALVLLRWEVLEGQLPPDVQSFQLKRGEQTIAELPASALLSPAQVQALYTQPEFQRQRLEMLYNLQRQGQAPAALGGNTAAVTADTLASAVLQRLRTDSLFAFLAPRQDIVAAAAMHRAFIDRPASGVHTYELLARDPGGRTARLGRATVDTAAVTSVSPASAFAQLMLGRCDAPETALDHGAVALTWSHGGMNASEMYANSLQIAGYEVWRSVHPLTAQQQTAPMRELAALTQGAALGPDGAPVIPDLRRVTPELVLLPGANSEPATDAEFVQTSTEMRQQGMRPGERYAYYVAPRDFTGAYGPTAALVVSIPDLERPPAPWSVEVVESSLNGSLSLEWDAVNLSNYVRAHRGDRSFCNLDTAPADGRLRYAPKGAACGIGRAELSVNLSVSGYRVYRFDSFDEAAAFSDRDGDGVADRLERAADGSTGLACDATRTPNNAVNHRVDGVGRPESFVGADGRNKLRFVDPRPQAGQVTWYRIAAMGANQQISLLSEPLRARFADRALPSAPGPEVSLAAPERCSYGIQSFDVKGQRGLELRNSSNGAADAATLNCSGQTVATAPLSGAPGESVSFDNTVCRNAAAQCGAARTTVSFWERNTTLATSLGIDLGSCSVGQRLEARNCKAAGPIEDGTWLSALPTLNVPPSQCVALYRQIGTESFRIGNSCAAGSNGLDLAEMGLPTGESICLSVAYQNENGRTSPRTRLPCFTVSSPQYERPPPPTPLSLDLSQADAKISWMLPEAAIGGTLIELVRQGGGADSVLRGTLSHPQSHGRADTQTTALSLPMAVDAAQAEEWCVTLKSVGLAAAGDTAHQAVSVSSAPLCAIRGADPHPTYLGWPQIEPPMEAEPLDVAYSKRSQAPIVRLAPASALSAAPTACKVPPVPVCDVKGCVYMNLKAECPAEDAVHFCSLIRSDVAGTLDFVAYRQSRRSGQAATDFVQVSPLVDRVHCSREVLTSCPGGNCTANGNFFDPYVGVAHLDPANGAQWSGPQFVFVDPFPHTQDQEYRYQFVYFNARGEITRSRTSGWLRPQDAQQ